MHNQHHVLVMCAAAFYLMENYSLDVGSEFTAAIIQVRKRKGKGRVWRSRGLV